MSMSISKTMLHQLNEMLSLTTKESNILFGISFTAKHIQICSSVEKISPSGPTLSNMLGSYYESNKLEDCPKYFYPVY